MTWRKHRPLAAATDVARWEALPPRSTLLRGRPMIDTQQISLDTTSWTMMTAETGVSTYLLTKSELIF